jgi:hypothetical protein
LVQFFLRGVIFLFHRHLAETLAFGSPIPFVTIILGFAISSGIFRALPLILVLVNTFLGFLAAIGRR